MEAGKVNKETNVLVIVPAYNEHENLIKLVKELRTVCPDYDYVIVNDGSTDTTRKVCRDNGFNMLDLPVNLGLSGAIRAGMKYANFYGYDYAVQIDGDGQHMPEYIGRLIECMEHTGADIVIGSRYKERKKPFNLRMLGSHIITAAIYISTRGHHIYDVTSGMRLFNKKMIKRFGYRMNYRPEPDTIAYLINQGVYIEEVQVEMKERESGESYLSLSEAAYYMLHVLYNILIFQWVRND